MRDAGEFTEGTFVPIDDLWRLRYQVFHAIVRMERGQSVCGAAFWRRRLRWFYLRAETGQHENHVCFVPPDILSLCNHSDDRHIRSGNGPDSSSVFMEGLGPGIVRGFLKAI